MNPPVASTKCYLPERELLLRPFLAAAAARKNSNEKEVVMRIVDDWRGATNMQAMINNASPLRVNREDQLEIAKFIQNAGVNETIIVQTILAYMALTFMQNAGMAFRPFEAHQTAEYVAPKDLAVGILPEKEIDLPFWLTFDPKMTAKYNESWRQLNTRFPSHDEREILINLASVRAPDHDGQPHRFMMDT